MRLFEFDDGIPFKNYDSPWYVHFFKDPSHGQQIITTGAIQPGSDGIVWAIKQGAGYNQSQIETDYETGQLVTRGGAILFSTSSLPTNNVKGLSAWDSTVELNFGFLIPAEVGKEICNNAKFNNIHPIDTYRYEG